MLRLLWWLLRLVVVGPKRSPRRLAACECRLPPNESPFPFRLAAFGLCASQFCERCCAVHCECKKVHVKAVLVARSEVEE